MNVVKCINGHHYDADKFPTCCPHCGAVSIVSTDVPEAKREKSPFWNRKRKKEDNGNFLVVPEHTIGKTFGVFAEEENRGEIVADNGLSHISTEADVSEKEKVEVAQPFEEVLEEDAAEEISSGGSLLAEIKKVSAVESGKTVGFFGAGTNSTAVEPVVGWLVCLKGKHFGESFNIASGRNSIGRSESNKIVLSKDDTISREKHALITFDPKKREFYIQSGDESGLSYLNDEIIMETKKIANRDILEFGESQYLFVPLCGSDFSWDNYVDKE